DENPGSDRCHVRGHAVAASNEQPEGDMTPFSSRRKDSTHLPLEVHKLRAARPQQSRLTGRLHGPVCLTGALPPTACCRTTTADPHNLRLQTRRKPDQPDASPAQGRTVAVRETGAEYTPPKRSR